MKKSAKRAVIITLAIVAIFCILATLTSCGNNNEADTNNESCAHTFEIHYDIPHYEHHFLKCSICGEITTETHTWEMTKNAELNSEYQHQVMCTICKCVGGQDHVFENGICACGYEVHKCAIDRATENYHRYSCDECENYERVYHNEETMTANSKNDLFHNYECEECGYEYAKKHTFRTTFDATNHYNSCTECKLRLAQSHTMANTFYGSYHEIECDDCPYSAERHIGVKYTTVDANSCQATCEECGITEIVEHDWDGFECYHCGYALGNFTFAVVSDITYDYYDDQLFWAVEFVVNDSYVYVDINDNDIGNWDFEEGDFVQIFHEGNNIYDIACLIDGDIVNDAENFVNYISDAINEKYENVKFEDLVIEEIEYFDNDTLVSITFESGTRSIGLKADKYVVYDLIECDMGVLEEAYAYLTFNTGEMIYFICFW